MVAGASRVRGVRTSGVAHGRRRAGAKFGNDLADVLQPEATKQPELSDITEKYHQSQGTRRCDTYTRNSSCRRKVSSIATTRKWKMG